MYRLKSGKSNFMFISTFFLPIIVIILLLFNLNKFSFAYLGILKNTIPGFSSLGKNENSVYVASSDLIYNDSIGKVKFNPLNYMQFSFFGFSQIKGDQYIFSKNKIEKNLLEIDSYADVPEGEVFFSEEDEYLIEESIGKDNKNDVFVTEKSPEEFSSNIKVPKKIALTKKNPEILIYHSHATESYTPCTEGNYHTLNEKYSVISVGSIIAKNLQDKYSYKVVHDKTYHDKDSYAYSYINSLATIKQQTAKNKTLKVFLDIHRDAFTINSAEHKKIKKNEYTATIKGKNAAKVMLVISSANPNYNELEKFAAYIKKKMDKLYPGLYLKTDKKTRSKYNLYVSDYSILIEVGCILNTIDEAAYTAELMSDVIGEVLKDLQE